MKNRKVICFHSPGEENDFLSNWYMSTFIIDGIKYSSMEQYMMHKKAMLFDDHITAAKILNTTDFAKIKQLGREVKNFDETIWIGMRQIIVYRGLYAKFTQDNDLKNRLLTTGDALLAECAVKDTIWGIGLSMTDERRLDYKQWKGLNLLGFSLMQVRKELAMQKIES